MGGLALAILMTSPLSTRASDLITLTIDSTRSSLTLSGSFAIPGFNVPATAVGSQSSKSIVDALGGTIKASLSEGVLSFSGGSHIFALLNPDATAAQFHPFGNDIGHPWPSGVDNFGSTASAFGNAYSIAYRNLVLDIKAGAASASGHAASGLQLAFIEGESDQSWPGGGFAAVSHVKNWAIPGGANGASGKATFDGTTLIIPVSLKTESFSDNIFVADEVWTGQIVAVVPEPGTLGLAGFGLVLLGAWKSRRCRRA